MGVSRKRIKSNTPFRDRSTVKSNHVSNNRHVIARGLYQRTSTKTRFSSPKSRAAGVTIVRLSSTILRPDRRACRTSSSQTNSAARFAAAGVPGSAFRVPGSGLGIPREARNWSMRGPSMSGLRPALWAGLASSEASTLRGTALSDATAALAGCVYTPPLDVQQMLRRDVVRRVLPPSAASRSLRDPNPVVMPTDHESLAYSQRCGRPAS